MSCAEPTAVSSCVGVMDRALAMERAGVDVIHLEKGEPDLDTPDVVKERALEALRENRTRYTASAGVPELRQAICDFYFRMRGVRLRPSQVFVTAGSSPALLTVFLAVLAPGDEVILSDPGYPSYPKLVGVAGGRPVYVPTHSSGFAYAAGAVRDALTPATRAIVVNSPSNPAGSLIEERDLREIAGMGPLIVSDDAYLGLEHDAAPQRSVLEFTDDAVLVGSFSKAFNMTGWRLGYLVAPDRIAARVNELLEDLFISVNAVVQSAGVTALAEAESILAGTRAELRARRDCLLAGIARLGFEVPSPPRGAPFVFAKLPDRLLPAQAFARRLLEEAHVAVTPG